MTISVEDVRIQRKEVKEMILWRCAVRIRLRRRQLGLSQSGLAAVTGLTVRRIAQCEKARSGLSASDLFRVAAVLKLPVNAFFDSDPMAVELDVLLREDPEKRKETEHLLCAIQAIKRPEVRLHLIELIETTSRSTAYAA